MKPENLLLSADGTPKLTDFGIAKLLTSTHDRHDRGGRPWSARRRTWPPSRPRAAEIGPATDVYACAVMLYETLAGRLPFPETSNPVAQLYQHVNQPPRSLREAAPAVPAGLCDVVMRAMAKAPAERYASGEELGVALAKAATAEWGPGWVQRTGITVMDRGRIGAATQAVEGAGRGPSARTTVIVHGAGLDHPILAPRGDPTPSLDVVGHAAPVDQAALVDQAAPVARRPGPAVLAPVPAPAPGSGRPRHGRSRPAVIAAIVLAVTAAVVAAVLTLAPRSGGEPQRSPDVTDPAYPDAQAGE